MSASTAMKSNAYDVNADAPAQALATVEQVPMAPAREVLQDGMVPADGTMMDVPLSRIRRNPKVDPRQHRNKARMASMLESFRRDGILQPITIRPVPVSAEDGTDFEVVAGNTRFEGALEVGHATIPALIRHVSSREAIVMAGVENMQRADLSPVEEGHHAARLLALHHNDHGEVCKLLDWSEAKLKSRVMITHVIPFVQDALVQGDLKLGHVELLSGVPQGQQERIASKIIEKGYSVAETRERLANGTRNLSEACFDLADCQGCRFNSSTMADMFASAEGGAKGKCNNEKCWTEKTQAKLAIIVTDAQENYGTVLRETEVAKGSHTTLRSDGDEGVGDAQLSACASCQHFGCIIGSTYGRDGKVIGNQCFNLECHAEKVQAQRTALTQAAEAAKAPASPVVPESGTDAPSSAPEGEQAPVGSDAAPKGEKAKAKAPAPLTPQTLKRGIKEVALTRFAQMGEHAVAGNQQIGMAIALLTLAKSLNREFPEQVMQQASRIVKGLEKQAQTREPVNAAVKDNRALLLARLEVAELAAATTELASLTVWRHDGGQQMEKHAPYQNAARYAQACSVNRDDYATVTPEYLKAQVKAGIIEDCQKSGFAAAWDAKKGDGEFSKLAKGKAADLIAAIEGFTKDGEFSFQGYEPIGFAPDFYFEGV